MPSDQSNMKKGRVKKTRSRPLPPNVAARNLAIEKQRREALNDTFLVTLHPCVPFRLIVPVPAASTCAKSSIGVGTVSTCSRSGETHLKGAHCEREHPAH